MLRTWTLPAALIPALIGATIAVLTRSTTIAAPGISHATAILRAIGYSLAALTITSTVLKRRDVTS